MTDVTGAADTPAAAGVGRSEPAPVTVLYVGGCGRSGSTLLDNVLGQLDGFVACGEVRYLWERGCLANRPCGCGRRFADCPMWQEVLSTAFPEGAPDPAAMVAAQRRHLRLRRLPAVLRAARRARSRPLDDYERALDRLYRAIATVTGARVVVDSSKLPPYGFVLARLPSVQFCAVHLVRDPRATAYSWSRRRPLPDYGGQRLMQRLPAWKAALLWTVWNAVGRLLWRPLGGRYLPLRYEDFIADPGRHLARVLALAGASVPTSGVLADGAVRLEPTHSVAGNPSRLTSGVVPLRPDTEWTAAMRGRDRWLVTALTWPLLRRYSYPLRTVRSARA